jgi:hypothetical protein
VGAAKWYKVQAKEKYMIMEALLEFLDNELSFLHLNSSASFLPL